MYDSVIFDVDGVLLRHHPDSPTVYADAVAEAFAAFDREPSEKELQAFVGDAIIDEMRAVCERHNVAFERFWRERERRVSALQQSFMERGDRSLFEDAGIVSDLASTHALGITSNNQCETVEFMLDHFDLRPHFDAVHARDPSVEGFARCKPDPFYVERTLSDLGAESVLFVGDSDADILAADAVGLDCAYVCRTSDPSLSCGVDPQYVVESLTSLRKLL